MPRSRHAFREVGSELPGYGQARHVLALLALLAPAGFTRQSLGGAALLFLGVFTPIVSLPFVGSQNYFQNGHGDGVVILMLAGISALLVLARRIWALFFTGAATLAILAFTLINFQSKISADHPDRRAQY